MSRLTKPGWAGWFRRGLGRLEHRRPLVHLVERLALALDAAAEAWRFRHGDGERLGVSFAARVGLGLALRL